MSVWMYELINKWPSGSWELWNKSAVSLTPVAWLKKGIGHERQI